MEDLFPYSLTFLPLTPPAELALICLLLVKYNVKIMAPKMFGDNKNVRTEKNTSMIKTELYVHTCQRKLYCLTKVYLCLSKYFTFKCMTRFCLLDISVHIHTYLNLVNFLKHSRKVSKMTPVDAKPLSVEATVLIFINTADFQIKKEERKRMNKLPIEISNIYVEAY